VKAQRDYIAGPVRFALEIQPDGRVSSVSVLRVPATDAGFEETVEACLAKWRFERAPPGQTGLRHQEGLLHFRLDAKEELAIRALLESLAAAWNAGNMAAVEDLAARGDSRTVAVEAAPSLRVQIEGENNPEPWSLALEPEVESIHFHGQNFVGVRQGFRRVPRGAPSPAPAGEPLYLDAFAIRGPQGWRFVRISAPKPGPQDTARVGGAVRQPRKVRNVNPRYPEGAKNRRIQGSVVLECLLTPEGKVRDITVLYAHDKGLADAAVAAVRQWEYTPTLMDGMPVPVIMTVTVHFRLS